MWLDSLYMGCPIQAMYAKKYNKPEMFDTLIHQVVLMKDKLQDKTNRLMHHAWDYNKKAFWCDSQTGVSPVIWGRAMGWYVVAILDIYEQMPKSHPKRQILRDIEIEILSAILKYRDENTYMWYQVVNMTNMHDNWLETSCSCLFTYAIAKAVRLGILDDSRISFSKESFAGIITHGVTIENGALKVGRVCIGTGVGEYNYYINRPTASNDLHGMGVFLLMCAEMAQHGM